MALPSPELLGTHTALAKILHTSGMAESIDKLMEDCDEIVCMANNGSTNFGDILSARLHTISVGLSMADGQVYIAAKTILCAGAAAESLVDTATVMKEGSLGISRL
ncbi:hypothetical protein MGYG_02946 [Nannizzia gypsea CBS 118893]|uniref:Uncharacterized protein n=1 Tax=Arthroderma gypseum (strain ATCC MYA-4604 / CBS 118893) TaxID=535722 RepID=E4UPW7_ARTGP|nr:hypothetical protein MGYG_02946 [Nannizzia gypsea CBS 118893]EFQ99939.1 hypothetical protein MGYG_02946 [Nannizzia gypsea CBS 118893]